MKKTGIIRHLFFYAWLAMLPACKSIPPSTHITEEQPISWVERQQQLAQITTWNTQGAIRIRTPETGGSASINWEQTPDHYLIRLFGPLGVGQVQLEGTPNYVSLITANQERYTASSAESLLAQHTGWNLPISNLYYWIRGLPTPTEPAIIQFDAMQRPITLQQQGWTIYYQQYTNVNGIDLPSQINLSNDQFDVRIIVSNWLI